MRQGAFKNPLCAFPICLGFILWFHNCLACLRPDGTDDSGYVRNGANFQTNLLWFKVLVPGVGVGYRYGSAVMLNREYALTAAHGVTDLLQFNPTYQVGTGSSYLTNSGSVVSASVTVYPGFDPSNPGSTIDLAIVHLSSPIEGPNICVTNATKGQVLIHAGFGMFGTPSTGEQAKDGNSRAFNAVLDTVPPLVGYSTNFYCATDFAPYILGNGKGLSGDSGGAVFDASTNLVGIMIAQTGDSGAVGSTIYLNLTAPDVAAWVSANTSLPSAKLSIDQSGGITVAGPTNFVYEIHGSSDLRNWRMLDQWTNFAGTFYFSDQQRSNFSFRFYRAVTR